MVIRGANYCGRTRGVRVCFGGQLKVLEKSRQAERYANTNQTAPVYIHR